MYKQAVAPALQKKSRLEKEHLDLKNLKATQEDVQSQELNNFKQEVDKLRVQLNSLQT